MLLMGHSNWRGEISGHEGTGIDLVATLTAGCQAVLGSSRSLDFQHALHAVLVGCLGPDSSRQVHAIRQHSAFKAERQLTIACASLALGH